MEGMHPAIVVTSAGNNEGWHLPSVPYLQRLSQVSPLSELATNPTGIFNRGVYFTNLYNFTGFPSKTKSNTFFKNKPGISYNYGNNTATAKGSFLIKVKEDDDLNNKSIFEVGRVDYKKGIPY